MQQRNLLSLTRRIGRACLTVATLALAVPSFAQSGGFSPLNSLNSLTSFFSRSQAEPATNNAAGPLTLHEIQVAPHPPSTIDLTARTDNLWDRMRNGFAMTNLNDDLVLHYQQWYQNRPEALRRMVERSRPYLFHIVDELEARGMPTELALLPMVESSFNPMAYSPAHAAGLWQFIPATGKRFNLEQSWWKDQRRDIVASTGAALDYLQAIYDMHGDWHLALASYNWGEGAVKRAVEKNTARGLPTDYPNLTMPNETRHYVPKLQALKNIFGNPRLMASLNLPAIQNRPYFATIDTVRPMDVKTVARLANMSLDEFLVLNPSHNRPVIKADTAVVLPTDKMEIFRSNLEKNAAPLTEWQTYTLKYGEKVAHVAPRFGITLPELMRVNGLAGKVQLGAGSTLLVPAGEGGIDVSRLEESPALAQIIEPEPVVVSKTRDRASGSGSGKAEKNSKADAKRKGKSESKESSKTSAKGAGKQASKSESKAGSKASGKAGGARETKASSSSATKATAKTTKSSQEGKPKSAAAKPAASTKPAKSGKDQRR